MGPRSIDRGNEQLNQSNRGCRNRFNGAAVDRPRKCSRSLRQIRCRSRLQWGRGRSTAEMGSRFNGAAVDRPRKCPQCSCNRTNKNIASMGPRSIDRGNAIVILNATTKAWLLQWGRGRSTAEIQELKRNDRRAFKASMGPRSIDRGNPDSYFVVIVATAASMGPRSIDRGNSPACHGCN